jgi:hypothetical protein
MTGFIKLLSIFLRKEKPALYASSPFSDPGNWQENS